ncbi:MAG: hypothetical protein KDB35_11515, partial [Acidimicrobiales bacterium]|nr:hypothetical protein [Acidimicrobiales bacterium]
MHKKLAGALLGVSIAGASLTGFTISSALAQEDPGQGDQPAQEAPEQPDGEGCEHGGRRAARAEQLAEIIGISVDELHAAREAGQTPAEIADDNGVSRDELVSALITDAEEHLDEAVADGRLTQEEAD